MPTRILVVVNDETKNALDELAEKENKPLSNIVREALEARLKEAGYTISTRVTPGGDRRSERRETEK